MKIILTIAILISSVFSSYSQTMIYFDSTWNKCIESNASFYRIIEKNKEGNNYSLRDYFISGELQMATDISSRKKEIKEGMCVWYFKNGQKKSECFFIRNKHDGYYKGYYENGKLEKEGNYINGKRDSIWTYWNEDGMKVETISFLNGKLNGIWHIWDEEGHKVESRSYLNDKLNGYWTNYYKNEQISDSSYYKNDKTNGPSVSFYENGELKEKGNLKNLKRDGVWIFWDKTGVVEDKITYSRGKFDGNWIGYYPNGEIENITIYKKDSSIIISEERDSTGTLLFQYKPNNNLYSGKMCYYFNIGDSKLCYDIKNGKAHGNLKLFFENGSIAVTGHLRKGFTSGKWTYYRSDGVIEKEKFYTKKNKTEFGETIERK